MAKFISTKIIDAEPALLVSAPNGKQGVVFVDEPIPVGSEVDARGVVVKTGFSDERGEHVMWIPEEDYKRFGFLPLRCNPDLPTDAPSISSEMVDAAIVATETKTLGDKTTVVRAVLWNGFEIVEASSCVSPENYNVYIGESICLEKIRSKVWMLLGFLLQTAVSASDG